MRRLFTWIALIGFIFLLIGCQPGQSDITISFEPNGGDAVEDMIVSPDSTDFVLPTPVRAGFTFDGWYLDADLTNPFTIVSLVTAGSELTLYAKWTPIEETVYVTITFESNGGSTVLDQVIVSGGTVTEPSDPEKTGYTFIGWYKNSGLTEVFNFSETVSLDITLYAKWEILTFTVTFYDDDETTVLKTETVPYGSTATPPANPTKPQTDAFTYTFAGWDKAYNNITANLNVYATYNETARLYTVTFYDDDETTVLKTETVPYGGSATPPADPTKPATAQYTYSFLGWDKSYVVITGNLSVYAMYESTLRSYTVTFYDDDETTVLKTETVPYGSAATPPADPTKSETAQYTYAFESWSPSYTNITGDLSVYANYTQTVRSYTVTFYDDDETTVLKTESIPYGGNATAPDTPSKLPNQTQVFLFDGWDKAFNNITGNLLVYATYRTEVRHYVVTYVYTHGEITHTVINDDTYPFGATNLDQYTPDAIEGFIFDGWYHEDDYMTPYGHTPLEGDITLYGRFIEIIEDIMPILMVHETSPEDIFTVRGIVYFVSDDLPGFMIEDATGHILVLGNPLGLSLGDLIEFDARTELDSMMGHHVLIPQGPWTTLDTLQPFKTPLALSLSDIRTLDFSDWRNFGIPIITSGALHLDTQGDEDTFILVDYGSDAYLRINPESYPDPNILYDYVDARIELGGLLTAIETYGIYDIHYVMAYHPITEIVLTDQEILDELIALAYAFLDQMVFYSGQQLDETYFTPPPIFPVTLDWETFGPNASLFNFDDYQFAAVETEHIIDIRITATIGDLSETIEIEFILKPIESITVAAFLAGENETHYLVEGVVLHLAIEDDEPNIIADETGFMLVMGYIDAEIGDRIILRGMRYQEDSMIFMVGTPDLEVISILASDQGNPLSPTPMTFDGLSLLEPSDYMGKYYIEITGNLFFMEEFMSFPMLRDGEDHLMIFPLANSYHVLLSLRDMDVTLRGFLFGANDPDDGFIPFMIFINFPGDIYIEPMSETEIIDFISDYLAGLNLGELRSFDVLDMPTYHPLFEDILISWTPSPGTLPYFDMMSQSILELTEETLLTFTINFTVGTSDIEFSLEYVAYPKDAVVIPFKTILQLHQENIIGNVVSGGVIYYISPYDGFYMFDGTGRIFVNYYWTDDLSIGDEVEFEGYVTHYGFESVKYFNVYDDVTVLDTGLLIPPPDVLSIGDALDLDYSMWSNYGRDVVLQGFLVESFGSYYLYDPLNDAMVYILGSSYAYGAFDDVLGKHVKMGALLIGYGDEFSYILYNAYHQPIVEYMSSDEDLVDMLIDMARDFLDGMVFLSGQTFPSMYLEAPPIFMATLSYETFGTHADLLDFDTLVFESVTEEAIIDVRLTITIGTITKSVDISFILKPITITDVIDVISGTDGELYVISGVVLFNGLSEYDPIIIVDDTAMILLFGDLDVEVGDEITVAGYRMMMDELVVLTGNPNLMLIEIISHDAPNPLLSTPMSIADILALDPSLVHEYLYLEVTGTVTTHEFFKEGAILADGMHQLMIMAPDLGSYDTIMSAKGLQVTLKGFLFPMQGEHSPFNFYLVFINYPGDINGGVNSDAAVITAVTAYIESLNQWDIYEGDHILIPDIHPFLGVDIDWVVDLDSAAFIDMLTGEILGLTEPTMITFMVSFTVGGVETDLEISYMVYPTGYEIPLFEPGYMGLAPIIVDPEIEGMFPGLYIYSVDHGYTYGSDTRNEVELRFPEPWEIGADYYTIELYNPGSESWDPLYIYDELQTATYNNYILYFSHSVEVRLRAHGEFITESLVSNSVTTTASLIPTSFTGWGLDESMWISGIMMPFVGRGLLFDHPSVYDLDAMETLPEGQGLSYQWYRVHPYTFEMTPIPGATNLAYTTNLDDVGYYLMIRTTGDGLLVGGYLQVFSFSKTLIPVMGFISQKTDAGFTLNLSHFVTLDDLDDLTIIGAYGELEITNITQGDNAAIYHIEVDLFDEPYIWIDLEATTWVLTSEGEYMMELMQGLYIEFTK